MNNSATFEYTSTQKKEYAHKRANENCVYIAKFLGCDKKSNRVSNKLPFVLLEAARLIAESVQSRTQSPLPRLCSRSDHYENAAKVLCVAVLNYDIAANLVAHRKNGKVERCDNALFASILNMPSRTVDNAIATLKRAGLYLSVELREEKDELTSDGRQKYRAVNAIKRLNTSLFDILGLASMYATALTNKKTWTKANDRFLTPAETMMQKYKRDNALIQAKRKKGREEAKIKREIEKLEQSQQSYSNLEQQLRMHELGMTREQIKASCKQDFDDIPY